MNEIRSRVKTKLSSMFLFWVGLVGVNFVHSCTAAPTAAFFAQSLYKKSEEHQNTLESLEDLAIFAVLCGLSGSPEIPRQSEPVLKRSQEIARVHLSTCKTVL